MPVPGPDQVLIRVLACGVCRTDLHLVDGELPGARYPVVPGHQVVGDVVGGTAAGLRPGIRVGVPWLAWACGKCPRCLEGRENLCEYGRFHGSDVDGGYAEFLLADGRFCLPLDPQVSPVEAAPLLCAGLIGYRTLRLAGTGARRIGLYGFGAAAHIIAQVARHQRREVFAFTRPGDTKSQAFARHLGAVWAGGSDEPAPVPLDAALIFAPAGELVPRALRAVRPGGVVVCGGIHMSDIPSFPYADLWGERVIRSVANLTRADGHDFLQVARDAGVRAQVRTYPLAAANEALEDLRHSRFEGSAVLVT